MIPSKGKKMGTVGRPHKLASGGEAGSEKQKSSKKRQQDNRMNKRKGHESGRNGQKAVKVV